MRRLIGTLLGLALMAAAAPGVYAYSRIKDITDIEGVRENQLVGYGLVVGLGTGGAGWGGAEPGVPSCPSCARRSTWSACTSGS